MIPENFIKYIEDSIVKNWDYPALSDYQGKSYTYGEVARKIVRIHIMFEECNVKKGDKIALIGKNSANWAMTYLAIISYGAVVVPILPDFLPNDVHHIVNHSDSIVLFTGDPVWENLDESSMPNLRAIFSLTDFRLLIESDHQHETKPDHRPSRLSFRRRAHRLRLRNSGYPGLVSGLPGFLLFLL
ncbi:MAG: AMP-binding protein [Bacteroidales bacterium]